MSGIFGKNSLGASWSGSASVSTSSIKTSGGGDLVNVSGGSSSSSTPSGGCPLDAQGCQCISSMTQWCLDGYKQKANKAMMSFNIPLGVSLLSEAGQKCPNDAYSACKKAMDERRAAVVDPAIKAAQEAAAIVKAKQAAEEAKKAVEAKKTASTKKSPAVVAASQKPNWVIIAGGAAAILALGYFVKKSRKG